jgi:hypothetical protein
MDDRPRETNDAEDSHAIAFYRFGRQPLSVPQLLGQLTTLSVGPFRGDGRFGALACAASHSTPP